MTEPSTDMTVADIRAAISDASEDERENLKAQIRANEIAQETPRSTVLDLTEPAPESGEPTYTVEDLEEGARSMFGCSPYAVAGALYAGRERRWTRDDAQQLIEAFLETPAVTAEGGES